MRITLFISVALNLLLLTTIGAARVDSERAAATGGGPDNRFLIDQPAPDRARVERVSELLAALATTSLETHDIRSLARAWIESRHKSAYQYAGPSYWQRGYSPAHAGLVMQVAVEAATRADLAAAFGPAVASDPAFSDLFRPLGDAYAFLGSDAQLALQRQQLERLEAAGEAMTVPPPAAPGCAAAGAAEQPALAGRNALPSGFSPVEAHEYRLRMSPLSEQLRQTGVAGGEREFRHLFDLLLQLESDMSPLRQAELRRELRALMGDSAFDRFWSMRDPFFPSTRSYLAGQGFDSRQIQSAHAIMYRSQEALMEIIGRRQGRESMLAALSQVRRNETAELTELLGAAAARGIQESRNRQATSAATGIAAPC